MPDYKEILYEKQRGGALITLNRPDAMNAISRSMIKEIHQALDEVEEDPEVRAVVLTGAGRAFSAGMDQGNGRPAPRSALALWHRHRPDRRRSHRLVARRSEKFSPHVGVRQADHRRDQRLGHGRGLVAVALHPHHARVGERRLRSTRSAPRFEHELHVDAARRLQERPALRPHRRSYRRPGSAAHRSGRQSRAGRIN